MSRSRILLAIFVGLPVTVLLTLNASVAESVSDECRARPGSSAAPGTYWRYRVSRPDHRRCWFLSFERVKIRSHAQQYRIRQLQMRRRSATVLWKQQGQIHRDRRPQQRFLCRKQSRRRHQQKRHLLARQSINQSVRMKRVFPRAGPIPPISGILTCASLPR